MEAGTAASDEATGLPREVSPQRTRLRERPWGMSLRFAAGGGGSAIRRCGCAHDMAMGIIASKDKSARTTAGGVATDEGLGGRVWQLALTRPREGRGNHRLCE